MLIITVWNKNGAKHGEFMYEYSSKHAKYFAGVIADSVVIWGSIGFFTTWRIGL